MSIPLLESPGQAPRRYSDVMVLEQLAELAARTDDEAEAEAFLGAIGKLASTALSAAAPVLRRAVPVVSRTIADVGKSIWKHPETRQLVRALPAAARRTAADVAGAYAANPSLSGTQVQQLLTRGLGGWLSTPDRRAQLRREHDRAMAAYHRQVQAQVRPDRQPAAPVRPRPMPLLPLPRGASAPRPAFPRGAVPGRGCRCAPAPLMPALR